VHVILEVELVVDPDAALVPGISEIELVVDPDAAPPAPLAAEPPAPALVSDTTAPSQPST
jgi:hypothetical protein